MEYTLSNRELCLWQGTECFFAEFQKKIKISGDALAIAEGEGRNAVFLAEQGMNVTAWDYAESGLAKTNKLAGERKVVISTVLVDLNEAVWKKTNWMKLYAALAIFRQSFGKKHFKV